jgi:predicted nucleic acid-binding protein
MSTIVLLDAGPLGLVTNPNRSEATEESTLWLDSLINNGIEIRIPEITDYEVRRELLRLNKLRGIRRLNELKLYLDYVPLTTQTMLKAAELWADVRKRGLPTADDKALDGDVILAAQAAMLENGGYEVIIATTNVRHLTRFTTAQEWREIS